MKSDAVRMHLVNYWYTVDIVFFDLSLPLFLIRITSEFTVH